MTRQKCFLVLAVALFAWTPVAWAAGGSDAAGYTWLDNFDVGGPAYNAALFPLGGTPVALTDDSFSAAIPIGFTFTFYGNNFTTARICSNGFLSFVGDSSTYIPATIPTAATPNNFIAVNWTDLRPEAGGTISYATAGASPNRTFTVEWLDIQHYFSGNPGRFQIILYETTNIIDMQIDDGGSDGSDNVCIGVENSDGSNGVQYFFGVTTVPNPDNRAIRWTPMIPSPVSNLTVAGVTTNSVSLTWTNSGDDGMNGTATSVDLRRSFTPIVTQADFLAATAVVPAPVPGLGGTPYAPSPFVVGGLPADTDVWFAIEYIDDVGNRGGLSNVVMAHTTDSVAPNPVTDLQVISVVGSNVTVQWTNTGDNGATGNAASVDIRIRTGSCAALVPGDFVGAAVPPISDPAGEPVPTGPGTVQTFTFNAGGFFTTITVAMVVRDEVPNTSGVNTNQPICVTIGAPSWASPIPGSDSGGGVSNTAAYSMDPCMDVNPLTNQPGVTWTDRDTTNLDFEIFMRESNGTAFVELAGSASGQGLSNNATADQFPDIVYDGAGRPVIAWQGVESVAPGDGEIFVRRFNAGAWQELAGSASGDGVSQNDTNSTRPSVDINLTINAPTGEPGVAWSDFSVGDFEIFFREFTGAAWVERALSGTGQGVSNNTGVSIQPSLAYDALGRPVIAWSDNTSGNWEIYLRRYNGVTWEELAGSGTGGGVSQTALTSQNPAVVFGTGNNNPFVVWQENLPDGNVEIYGRRFDGVAWVDFGPNSATGGGISVTPGRSVTPEICAHPGFVDVFMLVWTDFSYTPGASEIYGMWFDNGQWREIGTASAKLGGISNTAGQSISPCCGISSAAPPVIYVSWQEFSGTNYEVFVRGLTLFGAVSDSNEEFVVGPGRGGRSEYRVFDNGTSLPPYAPLDLRAVVFSAAYTAEPGELRPACGDTDGDGNDEIVVGQGPFPGGNGGWFRVLRDHSGVFAVVRTLRFPWSAYFNANGETFLACGDFDGDGRDEIAAGMGTFAPGGYVALFDDELTGFSFLRFIRINFPAYWSSNGAVHPALGDVDNDGRDEFCLGVGPTGGGLVQVLDDLVAGAGSLGQVRFPIPGYNTKNGETWPSTGNLTGGLGEEIVIGPGRGGFGLLYIYGDQAAGYARLGGMQIPSSPYDSGAGDGHPAVGNFDPDRSLEVAVGLGAFPGGVMFPGAATPSNVFVFDNVTTGSAGGVGVRYVNSGGFYTGPTYPAKGQLR